MGILKSILTGVVLSFFATPSLAGDGEGEKKPEADLRVGAFRGATYGTLDASMRLGRLILPHVMVREVLLAPDHEGRRETEKGAAIGGGYFFLQGEKVSASAEMLLARSWSVEGRATFLEPTIFSEVRPTAWLRAEVRVFPSLRLGKEKTTEMVVEVARTEVVLRRGLWLGAGWGALEVPPSSPIHGEEKKPPRAWQHAAEAGARWAPKGGRFGTLGVGYQGGLYVRYKTP